MPTASSITVRQTLELLDDQYAAVVGGVAKGEYAFWLGSGISRDRIIGLDGVLEKLLEFLRTRITAKPDCDYRQALDAIINMAAPSEQERAQIDFDEPVSAWECRTILLERLWKQYSAVLQIEIPGERSDYLLWEGLDFNRTFPVQAADAEHLAIGMLALEGSATKFASANWDGLIEAAMRDLGHGDAFYQITVTGADLRGPAAAAHLYKFHGCALRAVEDEEQYRGLLIARSAQIVGWNADTRFDIVRNQLKGLIQTHNTLMIGLSAQDPDIQFLFADAVTAVEWE